MLEVRPFARRDREQLSHLVNAHVAAATPGGAVPAAMLLNDMERPVGDDGLPPVDRTPIYAACWSCQNSSYSLGDI